MFTPIDKKWLTDRNLDYGVVDGPVVCAKGHLRLSSDEIERALASTVVIDGDLTVDGRLSVDDGQALVVTGRVECTSFWIGEGKLCAEELSVSQLAEFACPGDDMEYFDVERMKVPILCSPTSKMPRIRDLECEYVIEVWRAFDEESKLFDSIIADSFDAVYAALKDGEVINDAWCVAHKSLVTNPTVLAQLEPQTEQTEEIPKRVRKMLDAIANNATVEESELQGRPAVRVVYPDGSKQLSILSEAELAALRANRPTK